jgi:hypothetical protein
MVAPAAKLQAITVMNNFAVLHWKVFIGPSSAHLRGNANTFGFRFQISIHAKIDIAGPARLIIE